MGKGKTSSPAKKKAPAKKQPAPYTGPALTEENLSEADKEALAAQRAQQDKAKQCQADAKAAQDEIKRLKEEKAGLDKKSPDYKKKSAEIDRQVKKQQGIAKKVCKVKHPGCVPDTKSSRINMPDDVTDDINAKYGTNVDFGKLSGFEGGAYKEGYIPWSTHLDASGNPVIKALPDSTGKVGPTALGDLNNQPKNSSGATIGVGVDLGQTDEEHINPILDRYNADPANKHNTLSSDELAALKDKLKPYYKKKRAEACKFLKENPLKLTDKESNFMSGAEHDEAAQETISRYEDKTHKKFSDLSKEQQTGLLSCGYQWGARSDNVKYMTTAITTNDPKALPNTREKTYLTNAMTPPKK
jgi:hypothetical protein